MLGVNLLFRLGRWLLAAPLADAGLLPESYYRSQALAALEADDFPESLRYLKLANHPDRESIRMIGQLIILRCRLLREQHQRRGQAVAQLLRQGTLSPPDRYQELLAEEQKAVALLGRYEQEARAYLR